MKPCIIALTAVLCALASPWPVAAQTPFDYVDPRIGMENEGSVVVGPCAPFGMVRPSPDCDPRHNAGWGDIKEEVRGFSQTHVSGTGGAPKYGNILLMPFSDDMSAPSHNALRRSETIEGGRYATVFEGSGISTEITATANSVFYRFVYPAEALKGLCIDADHCQTSGRAGSPSRQVTLDGDVRVLSDHELSGFTTVKGGWNKGGPYTVYFHLESDAPFAQTLPVSGRILNVRFPDDALTVNVKLGISFLSAEKAAANLHSTIPGWDFSTVRDALRDEWNALLSRIDIDPATPERYRRMFYSAIYHAVLMPSDRRGEWSGCGADEPYYDDFYCLWDTYRTSMPLITLLDECRSADIVNSLLTIYRHDGYMPDGRSGNANGNTQGGSNAEIVIADAFVKGVRGIDYEEALAAMLKDAGVQPALDREYAEGRGALREYLDLGYIPFGINRAGNRTLEYAYCDYALFEVAQGLGREDLAREFYARSGNWRNIFRDDCVCNGIRGFVIPKDAEGRWLGTGAWARPEKGDTLLCVFTPDKSFGHGWGTYFYEANDFEMSLFVPHDVPALVEKSGGVEAFVERLDRFFDEGCYDAGNEPSFLTSCLYHWAGRPDRTSDRVARIIADGFDDSPSGIPGNDDSGAMSSWLAFHMMGLYPNAGQPYYLIHTPLLRSTTIYLPEGRTFTIKARGLSEKRRYIRSARLRGRRYPFSSLSHEDLAAGGTLVLRMGRRPHCWGRELAPGTDGNHK